MPSDRLAREGDEAEVGHRLKRKGEATFYNVYGLSKDENLEVQDVENRGPVSENTTYECSCGERFTLDETAINHLAEVGDER